MADFKVESNELQSLVITSDSKTLMYSDVEVQDLVKGLLGLKWVKDLDFYRTGGPGVYTYKLVARDGRVWIQGLDFSNQQRVTMTYDVKIGFTSAEAIEQRTSRELLMKMYLSGKLATVKVKWN